MLTIAIFFQFFRYQIVSISKALHIFITFVVLFFCTMQVHAISTVMNHRPITSQPLLYKQIDYAHEQLSIEFEPLVSASFNPEHIITNLIPGNAMSLTFNQQGYGDINPAWLYLQAQFEDYNSTVTFNPTQQIYGLLFHCYKQFDCAFFDIKTSLLHCKTKIDVIEAGGGNGILNNFSQGILYNAYQAFTQQDFYYGKLGIAQTLSGIDNIQILLGASTRLAKMQEADVQSYVAGFALIEVPTGGGTKSEWLFEPQIGGNHWGFGFGFDGMLIGHANCSFIFGGNFRHFIANWEKRSFDLTENGPWSRYLLVEALTTMPGSPTVGYSAINFLTQDALIQGRNQITMYARFQKKFESCLLELSYNLFYDEAETIKEVTALPSGYGIYAIQTAGGITTASTARINQALPILDSISTGPVELLTTDLDRNSGAAGQILNNSIAVRLQRLQELYTYGFGASIDLPRSLQGIPTWSVWYNFEILLS